MPGKGLADGEADVLARERANDGARRRDRAAVAESECGSAPISPVPAFLVRFIVVVWVTGQSEVLNDDLACGSA